MCVNYRPPRPEQLRLDLNLPIPTFEYRGETWSTYKAPMLIAMPPGNDFTKPGAGDGPLEWREAVFGLVPFWASDLKIARQTYNARSETIAERSSYRGPWARRRFCLVPAAAFFEPNYESGKPVRWRIERQDQKPFAIAGIWDTWDSRDAQGNKDGQRIHSFSMVTINADQHPLMKRFHAPNDEKRSIVVLPQDRWDDWVRAANEDDARSMLAPFPADEFQACADPAPPRTKKAA